MFEVKFDRKKYETLYEAVDDRNKVILYLLSKDKMDIETLCRLKISDVNETGVGSVELPRREQAALARYFSSSRVITSPETPTFPARAKDFLTPHKFRLSFGRVCKKAGVDPAEAGVNLAEEKELINENNVTMDMILRIIQEKLQHQRQKAAQC